MKLVRASAGFVRTVTSLPLAGTPQPAAVRQREDDRAVAGPHATSRWGTDRCGVVATPPVTGTFRISFVVKKPSQRPSGEKNGIRPAAVPLTACGSNWDRS